MRPMRHSQHKYSKCNKIRKKKCYRKSRYTWRYSDDISTADLDNLNEFIRSRKTDTKGAWKVVPKDSCEVYRERRKRQMENESQVENEKEESEESQKGSESKKLRKKHDKTKYRKESTKKRRQRRRKYKTRKRSASPSSQGTSTSLTYYTSSSEMEF